MSSPEIFYDREMGDQSLDVSAATRKFQTSTIIQQDVAKSGILSFLEEIGEQSPAPPTKQAPQTLLPRRPAAAGGGGYVS